MVQYLVHQIHDFIKTGSSDVVQILFCVAPISNHAKQFHWNDNIVILMKLSEDVKLQPLVQPVITISSNWKHVFSIHSKKKFQAWPEDGTVSQLTMQKLAIDFKYNVCFN